MKEYFERVHLLIVKMISVKGLVFCLATVFLIYEMIDQTTWWLAVTAIIAGRAVEKANRANHEGGN